MDSEVDAPLVTDDSLSCWMTNENTLLMDGSGFINILWDRKVEKLSFNPFKNLMTYSQHQLHHKYMLDCKNN